MLIGSSSVAAAQPSHGVLQVQEADPVHRFVQDGVTITWGDSPNMNDLEIRETPGASATDSSGAEAKIGRAILAAYRDAQQPPPLASGMSTAASDYCTWSPDSYGSADFKPACAAHDVCYSSNSYRDRATCDWAFKGDLNFACNTEYASWWEYTDKQACNGVAWTYYQAVRNYGESHYNGKGDPS